MVPGPVRSLAWTRTFLIGPVKTIWNASNSFLAALIVATPGKAGAGRSLRYFVMESPIPSVYALTANGIATMAMQREAAHDLTERPWNGVAPLLGLAVGIVAPVGQARTSLPARAVQRAVHRRHTAKSLPFP